MGRVKSWEGIPKPLCTDEFHFLTHPHGFLATSRSRKRLSSLLHGLAVFSFPSPYPECVLGVAGANGKEGPMNLGFEEAVFSPVSKLGVLLHVSVVYPFFSMAGKSFLGLPSVCVAGKTCFWCCQVYVQLEKPVFGVAE